MYFTGQINIPWEIITAFGIFTFFTLCAFSHLLLLLLLNKMPNRGAFIDKRFL